MFSQNVVDARELLMGPGECVWDSQQNSQAWSFSQNSNSQLLSLGNSSQNNLKYNNEFPNRTNKTSNSSDYWSQSQNISQSLNESDDGRGYHLKYLNKPSLNTGIGSSNRGQMKSLTQSIEIQRKKTFDLDTSNKFESILTAFAQFSNEITSSVGALKTEIAAEIDEVSKRMLNDGQDVAQRLEKLSGEMKDISKLVTETIHKKIDFSPIRKMSSKLENVELQMENIKAQVLNLEELNQQRNKEIDLNSKNIESLLLEVVSCVKKSQTEESIRAFSAEIEENSCIKNPFTGIKLEEDQREEDALGEQRLNDSCTAVLDSCVQRQSMQRFGSLSRTSPLHKGNFGSEASNQSHTVDVAPAGHVFTKKEPPSDDDYSWSLMRRTSKRPSQQEKDSSSASPVFLFDLCSDVEDSVDSTSLSTAQKKQERLSGPGKTSFNHIDLPCDKSTVKKFSNGNLKAKSTSVPSIQKNITSYGKIKKDSASEKTKIDALRRSPRMKTASKASPISRVISPKLRLKEKMRITSRGSIAKKRKEYAESVVCFDDYADMRKLQFQIFHSKKNHRT